MASKKQKDLEKTDKSIKYLERFSTEQILYNLSAFSNIPLHIKKAYKAILKERGIKKEDI
jgi:hypothetical protein